MELNEICQNARDNGMLDDPRVTFNSLVDLLKTDCGFSLRAELIFPNLDYQFPQVCGNCKWYSVQGKTKEVG